MEINEEIKDWQIAQLMFGINTKKECNFIKKLRKNYSIETLDKDYSIIYDTTLVDDCGWVISNELLIN